MLLPEQLKDPDFRFVPTPKESESPITTGWNKEKNMNYKELEDFLTKNPNYDYFVVCGFGGLWVIDFDDRETMDKHLADFPESFTVKSGGKGLYHVYFRT